MRTTTLLIAFYICIFNSIKAQKDTEFWFVCPEVSSGGSANYDRPVAFRFSAYEQSSNILLSQPSNPSFTPISLFIPANSTNFVLFPPNFNFIENTPPNTILNKGFYIKSTNPITAYYEVIGTTPQNPEIFSLKGKNALGKFFFIPFQTVANNTNTFNPLPSAAFDIIASEDNTTVTITPTKPIIGSNSNQQFTIFLNRGQTYSAQSPSLNASDHPSGTKVVSDKPISITMKDDGLDGGALFGNFCRDLTGTQLVPVEKIGTKYVVQKGYLNGNEFAFVVPTSSNTQVFMDGIPQGVFDEGQTLVLSITNGSHFIETSAPAYLHQMTGIGCELASEVLPALDCTGSSSIRFERSTNEAFYLFLVTESGNESGFKLNGQSNLISPNSFQPVPGSNGQYVSAVIPFTNIQVPTNQASIIENATGVFQMGFLNGGAITGCRFGYFSDFGNQVPLSYPITLCPGASITINGHTYSQPATVYDTIPGIQGCDTLVTYLIQHAPYDLTFQTDSVVCNSGQIDLHYTLCNLGSSPLPGPISVSFFNADPVAGPAIYLGNLTLSPPVTTGCYSGIISNAGNLLPLPSGTYSLYSVVNFDGSLPAPFALTNLPLTATEECNYENNLSNNVVRLPFPPPLDLGPDIVLCADSTVVFSAGPNFEQYQWLDGSTSSTFSAHAPGLFWVETKDVCGATSRDSVSLLLLTPPDVQLPDGQLCPGSSLQLNLSGFATYTWAPATGLNCSNCPSITIQPGATTTYTVEATTAEGCARRDTFVVTVLPLNTRTETIEFCPGQSVVIGGQTYSQPATLLDTISGSTGCDTVITYILQYMDGGNSSISLQCPGNISALADAGAGRTQVPYNLPAQSSDCSCPGTTLTLTQGLPPGSMFPAGSTQVCYQAADSCGNIAQCCFTVTVTESQACDVKEIGCMKYELIRITQNSKLERSYTVRVTNKCANRMSYTVIQLPSGMVARAPKENTIFTTSPGNRDYLVRNPNYSPFYSIRFKTLADSIANGQSDVFRYTLPPQAQPAFIHVTSRLEPQMYFEAHLNTFYCPIEQVQNLETFPADLHNSAGLQVYPNPSSGSLFADLSRWENEALQVYIIQSTGQLVKHFSTIAGAEPLAITLPEHLPAGLYFFEIQTSAREKHTARFVLQP